MTAEQTSRPLAGRAALITGANRGLGLAIAHAYVAAGADVFLCARDEALLDAARQEAARGAAPGQRVAARAVDVSKPSEVDDLARAVFAEFPRLHVLVNNAGVYGPFGPIEEVDWDAWRHAIDVNLMGSVLMCRAVVPHFTSHRYGKIVQLSGGGATAPLPRISAYAASKAAVVRFAESLAGEVWEHGVDVNSIAPGALDTRLLDQILEAGPDTVGEAFYARMVKTKKEGGTPLHKAASLAVFLASAESDRITGKLLSAVWDPWETLPARRDDLRTTDVYTIRRITPADRALKWP